MDLIRKIEMIIDDAHKDLSIFRINRDQAIFNFIRVFEDACRLTVLGKLLRRKEDPDSLELIKNYLGAISYAINWIYELCPQTKNYVVQLPLYDTEAYDDAHELFIHHAMPYSKVCEGYIGYSRGSYNAQFNKHKNSVEFFFKEDRINNFIADTLEFINRRSYIEVGRVGLPPYGSLRKLVSSVHITEFECNYTIPDSVVEYYNKLCLSNWDTICQLPCDWKFDTFSLKEFRLFWAAISTICFIHFYACILTEMRFGAVNHCVLQIAKPELIKRTFDFSKLDKDTIERIVDYLTYDNLISNNDVFVQPIIFLSSGQLVISPSVIINSNPERNLITLLEKKEDSSFSRLSNIFESLMQSTLKDAISNKEGTITKANIHISDDLPDIDFMVFDTKSQALFISELKWLNEPDSPKEVFAKEVTINIETRFEASSERSWCRVLQSYKSSLVFSGIE